MPYTLCSIPIENISPNFFSISKLRSYLGNYFLKFSLVITKFQNYKITTLFGEKFFRFFFCYFEISKLRNFLKNSPVFCCFEILKLRNYLGKNSAGFFFAISKFRIYEIIWIIFLSIENFRIGACLKLRKFEITKLFEISRYFYYFEITKLFEITLCPMPYALCPMPYAVCPIPYG